MIRRGGMHRLPNCLESDPDLQQEIRDGIAHAVDGM